MLKRIVRKIKNIVWRKKRIKINEANRKRLNTKAKTASIISMNCIGGILYHDLGLEFLSPTINLYMVAEDFIKFCENIEYYLSIDEFVECKNEKCNYPVVNLGDLTLYLVHYNSVDEAQEKWNERKKRVNLDNIAIICTDREGMNDTLKARFEQLPYKKVMFTHLPDEEHKSSYYIKGYENEDSVGIVTLANTADGLRPIDEFDYVEFLNR